MTWGTWLSVGKGYFVLDAQHGWQKNAACAGQWDVFTDTLFSYKSGDPQLLKDIQEMCDACPVKDACFEAGRFETAGVWGGKLRTPETAIQEHKKDRLERGIETKRDREKRLFREWLRQTNGR